MASRKSHNYLDELRMEGGGLLVRGNCSAATWVQSAIKH
jgi:hypothetical protein